MRKRFVRSTPLALAALLLLAPLAGAAPRRPGSPGAGHPEDSFQLDRPLRTKAESGPFAAHFREDRRGVAVLEFTGSYDLKLGGQLNAEARAVVAREFFATHPDRYDFLVVFTGFELDTGTALAFHLGVQNQVEGIGLPLFDESAQFGSAGKLQGYIDMAALGRHSFDPLDPGFEETLGVLAHETMHQWCCYAGARLPGGAVSNALRDPLGSHWSYLLDTGASLLYGADWSDNGDGSFTAGGVRRFYSPLDLYLAGFYSPLEVPPFFLIDSPGADPARRAERGDRVTGTSLPLGIDDLIAAAGERHPAAAEAQKEYRAAFLLLVRPGEGVPSEEPGEPGLPPAGPVRPPGAVSLQEGIEWLRNRQGAEGYWEDRSGTRLRDTAFAVSTLLDLDPSFTRGAEAAAWLAAQPAASTDSLARAAAALTRAGGNAAPLRQALAARQAAGGGWGIDAVHASDTLDTALALLALAGHPELPAARRDAAVQLLLAGQGSDGGWSHLPGTPSRTSLTVTALRALAAQGALTPAVEEGALAFLAAKQNPTDGGFGDSPSTSHDTAQVVETLAVLGALDRIRGAGAVAFLRGRQTEAGSWDGSVYATAAVLRALQRFQLPNLHAEPALAAEPASASA